VGVSVMHTHNTFTAVAQALNCPVVDVPGFTKIRRKIQNIWKEIDLDVNNGSLVNIEILRQIYRALATDLIGLIN
jgi:hypothetical protein